MRKEVGITMVCAAVAVVFGAACGRGAPPRPLVANGSFERRSAGPSRGSPFRKWTQAVYAGAPHLRVGGIAKDGESSCLLVGDTDARIRVFSDEIQLGTGRYRLTAWIRGLELAEGSRKAAIDFGLGTKTFPLDTGETFGWRWVEYIFENRQRGRRVRVGFGLTGAGLAWVDDVRLSPAPEQELIPAEPRLGPIVEPFPDEEETTSAFVECPTCGFRNGIGEKTCFACGAPLKNVVPAPAERTRRLVTFEKDNPFVGGGRVVETDLLGGRRAFALENRLVHWPCSSNWTDFDWFEFDVFVPGARPVLLKISIEDARSAGLGTRFNQSLYFPPGHSSHAVAIEQMRTKDGFEGGEALDLATIRGIAFETESLGRDAVLIDDLRLTRVGVSKRYRPKEMRAFDFGPKDAAIMSGFDGVTADDLLPMERDGQLEDLPRVYGSFRDETFDPLGRDYVCIEAGRLGVNLPDGVYVIEVTEAVSPGADRGFGLGGARRLTAENIIILEEDDVTTVERDPKGKAGPADDSFAEDLWDTYQRLYLRRHVFEVAVSDGRLELDFEGRGCSWAVAGVLTYPKRLHRQTSLYRARLSAWRKKFLENHYRFLNDSQTEETSVLERRDRLLSHRSIVLFVRPDAQDVPLGYLPEAGEITDEIRMEALAGAYQSVTFSVLTGLSLGSLQISTGALSGPRKLPLGLLEVGYVTSRFRAAVPGGSVYRIGHGDVIPGAQVPIIPGRARRIVLSVRIPDNTRPGLYETDILLRGELFRVEKRIVLRLDVRHGRPGDLEIGVGPQLDPVTFSRGDPRSPTASERRFAAQTMETLSSRGFSGVAGVPGPHIETTNAALLNVETGAADVWLSARENRGRLFFFISEPVSVPRGPALLRPGSFLGQFLDIMMDEAERKRWPKLLIRLEPRRFQLRRLENLLDAFDEAGSSENIGWSLMLPDEKHSRGRRVLATDNGVELVLLRDALDYLILPTEDRPKRWGIVGGRSSRSLGVEIFYLSRRHHLACYFGASWASHRPQRLIEPAALVAPWASTGSRGDIVLSYEFVTQIQDALNDLRYLCALEKLIEKTRNRAGQALMDEWMRLAGAALSDQAGSGQWYDWSDLRKRTLETIDRLARRR